MKQNLLIKPITLLLFAFLLSAFGFHRCLAQNCLKPTGMDYLDGNNIKALIKNDGTHFFDPSTNTPKFEVPKNSGNHTIFSSALWMGGWSLPEYQGTLHLAAMRFGQSGADFWAGPVSNGGADACVFYDHVWKVSKEEIDYHKAHYADADYVMPWAIANWPAHGRTEYGESAYLAPYKNVAGTAAYEPELGDYPLIRGDQAVYFIMNDTGNSHTETGGNPLGVEILGMAYAYDSPNEALQHCVFLSYEVRNKSEQDYHDFYFGLFNDFDIGYAWDDYVGCDTLLNLSYGYNGTEIDGAGEVGSYGENPPAQGAMFLNQKMNAFVYYNNIPDPVSGGPQHANHHYNYLMARWKDGSHITYGGTGTDPESVYTNYMYSGDPATGTGWTELTPNGSDLEPNVPGDRRGVMSAGPFTFSVGKSITVDIALPWARDNNNLASVALLKQYAEDIQKFYDENLDIKENTTYNNKLLIYPNPSKGQFTLMSEAVIERIELYDVLGKRVFADTPKEQTMQINTRLPQGLYLYRVVLQDNSVSSGKILVQ